MVRLGSVMLNFGGSQTGPANLVPFKTISVYLFGDYGWLIGGINLVGNIILLVPVGLLLPLVFENITWKKMLLASAAAGFAIEGTQVFLAVGIFDIDDVILNGLGVMTGYGVFLILSQKLRSMKPRNVKITAIGSIAAVAAIVFCAVIFYQKGTLPLRFEPGVSPGQSERMANQSDEISQGADPCGGTGGLGRIVQVGNHTITIQRTDSLKEIIKLTAKTTIKNASGSLLEGDLKIGDRATIVTFETDRDGSMIAAAVLVCNAQTP